MRRGVRIGVDVGEARVGVATSDPDGLLATPWQTLPRDREHGGDLDALAGLVGERDALDVIVGLPRTLAGDEGPAAHAAREYANALATRVRPVAVRLVDERLTTVDAHRALHDAGRRGRRHREVVDQVAATMILQAALDLERSSGRPAGSPVGARKPRHTKGQTR